MDGYENGGAPNGLHGRLSGKKVRIRSSCLTEVATGTVVFFDAQLVAIELDGTEKHLRARAGRLRVFPWQHVAYLDVEEP